jgi:hypothetical protein
MTSAIVYRESDFYIKNITTFTQYVLNLTGKGINNKLVTIMGEYHDTDMECKKDKIVMYVDDYVVAQAKNTKTKLLLEMLDDKDKSRSVNMSRIINKLETSSIDDIKNIDTIYVDYRKNYLDPVFMFKLYNNIEEVATYPYSIIIEKYIDPFYKKFPEFLDNDKSKELYSKSHMDIVMNTYVPQLYNSFNEIVDKIKNWDSMLPQKVKFLNPIYKEVEDDIKLAFLTDILKAWSRVADFYVIRELFKIDDTQQSIILLGQYHYTNIIDYLNNVFLSPESYTLTQIGKDQNIFIVYRFLYGSKDDSCINTLNTAYITSDIEDRRLRFVRPKIRK